MVPQRKPCVLRQLPALDDLVSELKLSIPVLACHQHFLADVGKDMLDPAHAELRALFRRAKVRPKLGALVRDLGRELGTEIEEARKRYGKKMEGGKLTVTAILLKVVASALKVFPQGEAKANGPIPAIMERMGGRSRMYLMLLSSSRASLHRQIDQWQPLLRDLPSARKTRWAIDIDPQEL